MNDSRPAALMRREISEQPDVLSNLIGTAAGTLQAVAQAVRSAGCAFAVLAARGSSDNASTYGKYLLESLAGLPTALAAPSLFTLYHTPPRLRQALVVGVSQSGQSADVVEVLLEARRQGAVTLGITNAAGSPLAAAAEHVILLGAGEERALAATKTVTAQCAVYAMLAGLLCGRPDLDGSLPRLAESTASVLAHDQDVSMCARQWLGVERAVVAARGMCYGAAQETALKLKETSFISAEPYSAADFMHGPFAMLEPDYPVLAFLNHDVTLDMSLVFLERVQSRGASVVAMATREAAARSPVAGCVLPIDSPSPLLSIIPFIVAGQLFAMHLSLAHGYNPDVSRGLTKVTVTR
jgi:glutamine---fructose-6-phosphate transaminase (isomerizing)